MKPTVSYGFLGFPNWGTTSRRLGQFPITSPADWGSPTVDTLGTGAGARPLMPWQILDEVGAETDLQ